MAVIEIKSVAKSFGSFTALHSVDLAIADREFMVLLGASGCGKTTLLRMIAGLETPSEGEIWIGGRRVDHLPPRERGIAMVFQNYAVFPHLTVYENIAFGLRMKKLPQAEVERRVTRTAELMHIEQLLKRYSGQLSGGQRQRVAVARALAMEPDVILMDEPLSNLDALLRLEMRAELKGVLAASKTTTIYVTHDQVEAITMADQVVLMNSGRIEQVASPREIYARPASPFAARFIGTPPMNILDLDPLADGKATGLLLGIRPEAVERASAERPATLRGTVSAIEFLGADTLLDCTVGTQTLQLRLAGGADVDRGELLDLHLPPQELHLFDAATGQRQDHRLHEIGPLLRL